MTILLQYPAQGFVAGKDIHYYDAEVPDIHAVQGTALSWKGIAPSSQVPYQGRVPRSLPSISTYQMVSEGGGYAHGTPAPGYGYGSGYYHQRYGQFDALQLGASQLMPLQAQLSWTELAQQAQVSHMPLATLLGSGEGNSLSLLGSKLNAKLPIELNQSLAAAHEAYKAGEFSSALAFCNRAFGLQAHSKDVLLLLSATHYQLGNLSQCILYANKALQLQPEMAEAHSNLANALQRLNQLDLAVAHYRAAISLKPNFTDAYNNLASALVQKGAISQAIECYNLALSIDPSLYVVYSNLGDLWKSQGVNGRVNAEYYYKEAVRYNQRYVPAWFGLAEVLKDKGDYNSAISSYKHLLKLQGSTVEIYSGLGHCFKEMGKPKEAEKYYHSILEMNPRNAIALASLAGVYYDQGRLGLAIETYRNTIKLEPNFPEAYNNLSNALREAGYFEEAANCYMICIRMQCALPPNSPVFRALPATLNASSLQRLCVVYNNLGGVLKIQGKIQEAIACFQQVRALQPNSAEAHANLASAFKDFGKHDCAIVEYRLALELRPNFPEAFANYVHSMQCTCDWRDRKQMFEQLEQVILYKISTGTLPPVQPFHAMAYPFSEESALRISRAYAEQCKVIASRCAVGQLTHPPRRHLKPKERLRVGFVSSDFGNHPLSHLMASVFEMLNRDTLEVFCYALSPNDKSEWRQSIQASAEHFIDVSAWTSTDIARQISRDGIHIAVNLNGYTKGAKNEIFAMKPAPVQCSYMGFPATTGADFLPYLISDKVVAPPHLHYCYSEKLALMPNCYFVNDYKQSNMDVISQESMPTRAEVGLPEDKIIFSCSNQLYKYDPDTFQSWCKILKRVPNSVLWLLRFPPEGEINIRAEAQRAGIGNERIIFTDVAQKNIHIKRSGLADVFLDTPLCNAHTTGCDVLWSGCPMVTLALRRMASRVAASLCYSAGCPELVVHSHSEYEDLAVRLGTDHRYRLALKKKLMNNRLSCPLFDTRQWVYDFEKVFFKMWDIHASGKSPQTFEV